MEAAALQTIRDEVEDGVATISFNRPAQKNALDKIMRTELAEAMVAVRRDRGIHALVLTGAGGAFCAGGDIRGMQSGEGTAEEGRNRMLDLHLRVEELINCDRPVVAAVDGPAFGAGFGLALAADFVLATPRARFCLSFLKLGLIPDCGGVYVLATGHDHVLDAVHDIEMSVFVPIAAIACVQPAIAQGRRRFFGLLPVAEHDASAPDNDFAHRSAREFLPVAIDNPDFADLACAVN